MNFNKFLDKTEEYIGVVAFAIMSLVIFIAVLCRFVFKIPFSWGEELARWLMIYSIFIGISIGVRKKAHLGVEAFVGFMPKSVQKYAEMISQIASCAIFVILLYLSIKLTVNIKATGQQSPAMMVPMYIAYMALPIGFALSIIRTVQVFYVDFIKKEDIK